MSVESQLLKTINQFIGPCAHGSDPYDRCEECEWLSPIEAKVVALKAEVERLNKRLESEQHFIDSVCHYRNLAIVLGAKPEQMLGKFDRELCEGGIDPNETSGGYHVSVNQQLDELKDAWAEVERLKSKVAKLRDSREAMADILREMSCGCDCDCRTKQESGDPLHSDECRSTRPADEDCDYCRLWAAWEVTP